MKYIIAIVQTGLLTLLCCTYGQAATVYKTVDEDGVVSFSDAKPVSDGPVETLKINAQEASPGSAEQEEQRMKDMRETTDRMAADRMAREKQRDELRQQQPQPAPPQSDYSDYMGYSSGSSGYNGYYGYPVRRPVLRPGPKPEHPIARPPIRPRPAPRGRR
ncbi:MAG: DUF4124 domain-containing protein [Gammaproteobacteria bacterium]|nr:MAG: DUF4124 domain-containing protein [Gammaproteobacteria bacterium]